MVQMFAVDTCHHSIVCCLALIDICKMDSEWHSSDHRYQDIVAKPILPNLIQHNFDSGLHSAVISVDTAMVCVITVTTMAIYIAQHEN